MAPLHAKAVSIDIKLTAFIAETFMKREATSSQYELSQHTAVKLSISPHATCSGYVIITELNGPFMQGIQTFIVFDILEINPYCPYSSFPFQLIVSSIEWLNLVGIYIKNYFTHTNARMLVWHPFTYSCLFVISIHWSLSLSQYIVAGVVYHIFARKDYKYLCTSGAAF